MANKVLYAALMFLAGWLWYFLIVRQFVFNFTTVLPMLKRFRRASQSENDLISVNSSRFVAISIIVWIIISLGIFILVAFLCRNHIYLTYSFLVGGIIGAVTFVGHYTEYTERNFKDFCSSYYRFVFDDELRTAMYNSKISAIKIRLDAMNISKDLIVPKFKN